MYDRQTETLWSHFTGQAVIGFLTGSDVEVLPVATVSWEDFRTAHPDGLVLSREPGSPVTTAGIPTPATTTSDSTVPLRR